MSSLDSSNDSRPSAPPEAWEPLLRFVRLAALPLERFLRIQAASGILLMIAAGLALAMANSPWAGFYERLWELPIGVRLGEMHFERSLAWVVNDALMAIFFFVVGLEIRREIHHGELSDLRRAALPLVAALGGMVVPALMYLAVGDGPTTRVGWGIPMATDIAFAVGVLTLLGARVPAALRVLLLALAVIDDLGAILVIALFYSSGVQLAGLAAAALGMVGIFAMQALGIRRKWTYVFPGVVIWAGMYGAGIHPTIAGVLVGLVTPVRAWLGPEGFQRDVQLELERLASMDERERSTMLPHVLGHVEIARREAISPAESLIEKLHPWVAFGIMPLFAFANAGVSLAGVRFDADARSAMFGVALGLLVGKPVGILLASGLAIRFAGVTLPTGLTARHLVVLGLTAGIGFTMSLFIAHLAFPASPVLGAAKVGVLVASGISGVLALLVGALFLRPDSENRLAARSADEAESSTEH